MFGRNSIRPAHRFPHIPTSVAALLIHCCGIALLGGVLVSTDGSSAFAESHHSRGGTAVGRSSGGHGGHVVRSHSSERSHVASHGGWARDRGHRVTNSGTNTKIAKSTSSSKHRWGRSLNKSSPMTSTNTPTISKSSSMGSVPAEIPKSSSMGSLPSGGLGGGNISGGSSMRSVGPSPGLQRGPASGSGEVAKRDAVTNRGLTPGPGSVTPKNSEEAVNEATTRAIEDCARKYPSYDRVTRIYTDADGRRILCP
jgi:hypothetical protein